MRELFVAIGTRPISEGRGEPKQAPAVSGDSHFSPGTTVNFKAAIFYPFCFSGLILHNDVTLRLGYVACALFELPEKF